MLFSSLPFLFGFLPAIIFLVLIAERFTKPQITLCVLILGSLFFYAWWNPPFVLLLIGSVIVNYGIGIAQARARDRSLLALAVVFNLGLIAYFKYAGFFVGTVSSIFGVQIDLGAITLPLAISFFTFQQIAYQVDVYQGKVADTNFIHYSLFVTFFPQLIAGPIVHHQEVIPQFEQRKRFNISRDNLVTGGMIFAIGLYKKVVIADSMAPYSDGVFDRALEDPTALEAWGGALAYTMQIYFDFSGYSDMAIGLARLFGIRLPANFASPYKATNIIDFWKAWHITLSRFLRDYLYIPLGGNRRGDFRRYANLLITMLLGGLWHGANWTFVFWGGLHGAYLAINHLWRARGPALPPSAITTWVFRFMTFVAVVISWVFFRADSFDAAAAMLQGMIGLNGWGIDTATWRLLDPGFYSWFCMLLGLVWLAPNTQEILRDRKPVIEQDAEPRQLGSADTFVVDRRIWLALSCAVAALIIVVIRKASPEDFIYMVF